MSPPIDLLPPEGMTLEAAAGAIGAVLTVRARPARGHDRSYYDTFDGLVRAAGLAVVHEDGILGVMTRATGVPYATLAVRRPTRPLLISELPPGALREALADLVDVRALLAVARVHSREHAIDVLDDRRKTVVRLALAAPAVLAGDRSTILLRPRLALDAVRGYDDELEHVRRTLIEELGFAAAERELEDEAVLAGGGVPGGVSSSPSVPLERGESAGVAVAKVLRRLLEVIEANFEGALADIDTEFLHDLRVAVRRSRAVQRELRGIFPAEELAHFRAEFRWLQAATGPCRDLDVWVLGFDAFRAMVGPQFAADLEPLLDVLRRHRRRSFLAMRRALRSERTQRLLSAWSLLLARLPEVSPEAAPDARLPIEQVAGERIRKVYRRMVRMGNAIGPDSPAEDLHELRKQGKELRYLLELFGAPLFPEDVVRPLIKTLKTLQDVLGRHQDRAVQVEMLRGLRREVGARPAGADALVALGALAHCLLEDEQAARSEFAERFASFASPERRRQVKETFR